MGDVRGGLCEGSPFGVSDWSAQPNRLRGGVPAQRVFCAIAQDRAGHEGGLVEQLRLGLAFTHPCVEVAIGLRFAIHQIVAEFRDEGGPFGFGKRVSADVAGGYAMAGIREGAFGFFTLGAGGQAVEDHGGGFRVWVLGRLAELVWIGRDVVAGMTPPYGLRDRLWAEHRGRLRCDC